MAEKVLDPRAYSAVDFLRKHTKEWAGNILPRWLPAALPARSAKRGWRDAVSVLALTEILGAHRVREGEAVFFKGPLYQINRLELARGFCTDLNEISETINWLEQIGVIGLVYRTRLDAEGQPRGSMVFAYPVMAGLEQLRRQFLATGKSPKPVPYEPPQSERRGPKPGSRTTTSTAPVVEGSALPKKQFDLAEEPAPILTAPKAALKLAASGDGETSTQRQQDGDDRRSRTDGARGGEAAKHKEQRLPETVNQSPSPQLPSAHVTHNNNQASTGLALQPWRPPRAPADLIVETPDQQVAWRKASRLCTLYSQVVMRSRCANTCQLSHRDAVCAFNFFGECPASGAFYVTGVFINALLLANDTDHENGSYDHIWHCRFALDFRKFLAFVKSGKIESELGRAGNKINTWSSLRLFFTQSELIYYGWSPKKIPIMSLQPDDPWENDPAARTFYLDRGLALPPEFECVNNNSDEPKP
jgi:hypothetical protein